MIHEAPGQTEVKAVWLTADARAAWLPSTRLHPACARASARCVCRSLGKGL